MLYVSVRVLTVVVYAFLKDTLECTLPVDTQHCMSSYLNLNSFRECLMQFRNAAAVRKKGQHTAFHSCYSVS